MRKLTFAAALGTAALFAGAFTPNANATIELQITDTVNNVTSGVIIGTPLGAGSSVSFLGTVGAWNINITNGLSDGPLQPTIDLSSINATTTGAGSLKIQISDNGFTLPLTSTGLQASGHNISGTGTSSVNMYLDTTNALFGTGTLLGSLGPFSSGYNDHATGVGTSITPFSLSETLFLTSGANGVEWSTDSSITGAVPEPGSLTLLGTALLALGWIGWRRKRTS